MFCRQAAWAEVCVCVWGGGLMCEATEPLGLQKQLGSLLWFSLDRIKDLYECIYFHSGVLAVSGIIPKQLTGPYKEQYTVQSARQPWQTAALPPVLARRWVQTQPWRTPRSRRVGRGEFWNLETTRGRAGTAHSTHCLCACDHYPNPPYEIVLIRSKLLAALPNERNVSLCRI